MDISDVIGAVLKGSPAYQSTSAGATPPRVVSHQKQPSMTPQPSQTSQGGGDILGDILGSVLGQHRSTQTPTMPGNSVPGMPTTPNSAGGFPWGDIMGTMMGAGLGSVAANTVLAPIINQIADRFHIPPRVAQMVVAFAIAQLVQAHTQGGTGRTQTGSFQTNQLVDHICSHGGCSESYLNQTGMPQELAQRSGLDPNTSAQALQYALNALGQQTNL